jgi:hypothetical protein
MIFIAVASKFKNDHRVSPPYLHVTKFVFVHGYHLADDVFRFDRAVCKT